VDENILLYLDINGVLVEFSSSPDVVIPAALDTSTDRAKEEYVRRHVPFRNLTKLKN